MNAEKIYKALTESRITVVEITIIESSYSLLVILNLNIIQTPCLTVACFPDHKLPNDLACS